MPTRGCGFVSTMSSGGGGTRRRIPSLNAVTKSNASCYFTRCSCGHTAGTATMQQRGRLIVASTFLRVGIESSGAAGGAQPVQLMAGKPQERPANIFMCVEICNKTCLSRYRMEVPRDHGPLFHTHLHLHSHSNTSKDEMKFQSPHHPVLIIDAGVGPTRQRGRHQKRRTNERTKKQTNNIVKVK